MKIFKTVRNHKGFTLIELAIVLVIIGIILGAVLKGQDLMQGARAKQFVTKVKAWEIAQWEYMDRKGRFAGDADKTGKIGDGNVNTDLVGAKFINPPYEGASGAETNTISMGSYTFYVFFGTDGGSNLGKNIMTICKVGNCATAFTSDELMYVEALDVSIDGSSDGLTSQVIGVDAAPAGIAPSPDHAGTWIASYAAAAAVPAAWSATTQALVYYFDAKR
jgi:prepilin-type N-terminal cleavage/methylation domain-containing protein